MRNWLGAILLSLKKDLLKDNERYPYIPHFDFICRNLSMEESAMLSYFIDLVDFKNVDNSYIQITPKYVQYKRPLWTVYTIRKSLDGLVQKNLLLKKALPNGNYYKLNKPQITKLAKENNNSPDECNIQVCTL